jgi:hypothetical protein
MTLAAHKPEEAPRYSALCLSEQVVVDLEDMTMAPSQAHCCIEADADSSAGAKQPFASPFSTFFVGRIGSSAFTVSVDYRISRNQCFQSKFVFLSVEIQIWFLVRC